MAGPTTRSLLTNLSKARLAELGRAYGVPVHAGRTKEEQIEALVGAGQLQLHDLVQQLGRDELRASCRALGLPDTGRSRPVLAARLLESYGAAEPTAAPSFFAADGMGRDHPERGDILICRHRQWLVEDVVPASAPGNATLVRLVCLDDDNQGRALEGLWELELGARVLQPEAHGLGDVPHLDEPRAFGAYLHALKWSSVTATDARLFQAPFRAGIQILDYQLTPLLKALALPRANLFIADDVGLGKTIEAGLVLQELLLRQRVEMALVVCPAAVCLQWRDEIAKRFGLRFEVMSRRFIARRRQERGFGVNPWSTHNRFIVSYQTLRRPEYRDPLLAHIGERARRSLLILDEAHVAAPASESKYAIDSAITRVVRDVAPRFENRLFLSATPHNGHSNSFSALLEILDPQRFTRGVPVTPGAQLEPIMVRRLQDDLRKLGMARLATRLVVQGNLRHTDGRWHAEPVSWDSATRETRPGEPAALGAQEPFELTLATLLAEYTKLRRPTRGQGKLVFINLQKRLLSSVEAFARTLRVHARPTEVSRGPARLTEPDDDDEYGDDDALDAQAQLEDAVSTRVLTDPAARAQEVLAEMMRISEHYRTVPDAKVLALLEWIRRNQCPGVGKGGRLAKAERAWNDRRVLLFTEYGDTKRYLVQMLRAAIEGTDDADERIMTFHGGMSDEEREEVQRAFNGPPGEYPVRILVATDAAREGVNLQGHCADLFHFDIPWNPARMEQRNGRIDRTMQPEPEVRCHYFLYPQRAEDVVLAKLVTKIDVIRRELGSLGAVFTDRVEATLRDGIDERTTERIDAAEPAAERRAAVGDELEAQRSLARIREEQEAAGEVLQRSRRIMEFDPALLRDAIDVGLELAGSGRLTERDATFTLPEMPASWQETLDTLRPPRGRDEQFWDWRKRRPQPVVFHPPATMNDGLVQLHLQHPFVQRILGRFLAQGWSAHDLSRVTLVSNRDDALVRVIGFGRLCLFGPGATRLHDQLVSVAARWVEGGAEPLRPFAEAADRSAIEKLERALAAAPTLDAIAAGTRKRVLDAAPRLFADLWPHIRDEADALAKDARDRLVARGREEADALRRILEEQRRAITHEIARRTQMTLEFGEKEKEERAQFERDRQHMEGRLSRIDAEIAAEPPELEKLYEVARLRLEPVGLVVLWPASRT